MLKLEACALESYNIGIAKNAFFPEDGEGLGFSMKKWTGEAKWHRETKCRCRANVGYIGNCQSEYMKEEYLWNPSG